MSKGKGDGERAEDTKEPNKGDDDGVWVASSG
jgi:hypothetical protein